MAHLKNQSHIGVLWCIILVICYCSHAFMLLKQGICNMKCIMYITISLIMSLMVAIIWSFLCFSSLHDRNPSCFLLIWYHFPHIAWHLRGAISWTGFHHYSNWMEIGFSVTPLWGIISLQNVAHGMTAQLSCHVQNFVVITSLQFGRMREWNFHWIGIGIAIKKSIVKWSLDLQS